MLSIQGHTVHDRIRRAKVECEFIYSGSEDQEVVAKRWNNDNLRVLISTTLGLVGNESTKTQYVCIVGILYNLPSVIQSIGRIRPRRRTEESLCRIFTAVNNLPKMKVAMEESKVAFDELVCCGVLSSENKPKYFQTMTMSSVNNWLFNDKKCRLATLGWRLGYRVNKCDICDICTNSEVRQLSQAKKKHVDTSRMEKQAGVQLLGRMKVRCICCNSTSCVGSCIVKKFKGLVCYHCLGAHRSSQCTVYKPILKGKACYACYVFNYGQEVAHNFQDCAKEGEIRERLRALIQRDYLEKRKEKGKVGYNFNIHLAGIFADEEKFFRFLYKYKDWK